MSIEMNVSFAWEPCLVNIGDKALMGFHYSSNQGCQMFNPSMGRYDEIGLT